MSGIWGVFEWRCKGRYMLADVVGSRVFKRRTSAEAFLEKVKATRFHAPNGGYVIRAIGEVNCNHCVINDKGKVTLTTPCTCGLSMDNPSCPVHYGLVGAAS